MDDVTIGIISDGPHKDLAEFSETIQAEIRQLLEIRYEVNFRIERKDPNTNNLEAVYQTMVDDPEVDFIIVSGLIGSSMMLLQNEFPKPCHAAFIIDGEMMSAPLLDNGTTGVRNFSYTTIPTDPERDLNLFNKIFDYKKVGIVVGNLDRQYDDVFTPYFKEILDEDGKQFEFIHLDNYESELAASGVDALYYTVFGQMDDEEIVALIDRNNQRGLPSFAMMGRETVELGALAGLAPSTSFDVRARRIAINVMKALDGSDPATFPVEIIANETDFVVNMLTAEKLRIYPPFDLMSDADLLNVTEQFTDKVYTLQTAILESLAENLDIQVASYDLLLADKDVMLAASRYLPQGVVSLAGSGVDPKIHNNPLFGKAPFGLSADAGINQTFLSVDAISNIVIAKLLKELQQEEFRQVELDIIFQSANAYLNILLARSNVRIQNENVSVTRSNLNISEKKVSVGYSGEADKLRWESQFALNKIDLNDAVTNLRSSRYILNRYLNNEIKEPFRTEDLDLSGNILIVADDEIVQWLVDPLSVEKFTDFLVEEGLMNLPELKQIESALEIQEKSIKWAKASFAAPDISGNFGLQYNFYNTGANSDALTFDRPYWSSGVTMSLPISTGGQKFIRKQQLQIGEDQLNDQYENAQKLLEQQIRSNMEDVSAAFTRMTLSREAAEASRKSLTIAQDSYSKGLSNITTLIDFQNASLQAEQLESASTYQFFVNFLSVERSIGFYYFLATDEERTSFKERLEEFMLTR